MKIKQTLLATSLFLMASSAFAGTYTYNDTVLKMSIKGGDITSESCVKKECDKVSYDLEKLEDKIKDLIKETKTALSDKAKVQKEALTLANKEDAYIIKDETSGVEYVMVSLSKSFNLPVPMESVKKKDMSIVISALQANLDRYTRSLDLVSSGKLPKDIKTGRYSEVSGVLELHNVIKFADYM